MKPLKFLMDKDPVLAIGLMSGTSADGMDAALVRIKGWGLGTCVEQLSFVSLPYEPQVRSAILRLAGGESGGTHELSLFHFLLGELSLEACLRVCEAAGVAPSEIDFVGSHGQTLYHAPVAEPYLGRSVRATLQMGEPSVIAEGLGCPVVSDFRVRDMVAGGLGAPLVPYTEYLLYRSETQTVGLQNIGGIGNLTVLPRGGALSDTYAFDTGPGNMVMDQLVQRMTQGARRYDEGGALAAQGTVSDALLSFLLDDPYLSLRPPKTTGREVYGSAYVDRLTARAGELGVSPLDALATATRFTAECVRVAIERFCPQRPQRLIVGGGGSRNPVLMGFLRKLLDMPVDTNESLGFDSDAKEAVAFAVLANECLHGVANNVPTATGARHPVVMGKVSL